MLEDVGTNISELSYTVLKMYSRFIQREMKRGGAITWIQSITSLVCYILYISIVKNEKRFIFTVLLHELSINGTSRVIQRREEFLRRR